MFIDRFGAKATKASVAHNMEKRIGRSRPKRVDACADKQIDCLASLKLPAPPPTPAESQCSRPKGMTKGYGGPPVFYHDVNFAVERGERLLVLGLNGAGKTSLLRILAGETDADAGLVSGSDSR